MILRSSRRSVSQLLVLVHLAAGLVAVSGLARAAEAPAAKEAAKVAAAGDEGILLEPESFLAKIARLRDARGRFPDGTRLVFSPGEYRLEPQAYVDSTCGNCEEPATQVAATLGLRISGSHVVLTAQEAGKATIFTDAGYGLLFADCQDCALSGLTITGGRRDPDPNATDAAVLVQRGAVSIEDCLITDNIGDSTLLATQTVGIIGIAGREGGQLSIRRNRIRRNSWDGIALYRGAEALIERNEIDGVDTAGADTPGGGRGVAIGATWDAKAKIFDNTLSHYWKGIGVFVDADCLIRKNYVLDMKTWGIAVWDAGKGSPRARIEGNIIFQTGACGIAITLERPDGSDPGHCTYNVLLRTGLDPAYDSPDLYCVQCPIAAAARPQSFEIKGNMLFDNRRVPRDAGIEFPDMEEKDFRVHYGAMFEDLPIDSHLFFNEKLPPKMGH